MEMTAVFTTIGGQMYHENRGGTETLYIPDPLGSLIACKNTSGTTTYTAEYWPYGEVRTESGTNPSKWGFVGLLGYLTDFASLLYVRARFYKPNLGRWASVDPLWPRQRPYVYSLAAPITNVDPSGLLPWPLYGLILLYGLACILAAYAAVQMTTDIPKNQYRSHCVWACLTTMFAGPPCGLAGALLTELISLICKLLGKECGEVDWNDVVANMAGFGCGSLAFGPGGIIAIGLAGGPRKFCDCCCAAMGYGPPAGAPTYTTMASAL